MVLDVSIVLVREKQTQSSGTFEDSGDLRGNL